MEKNQKEESVSKIFSVAETEKLPRSLVRVEAEISAEHLQKHRDSVLKKAGENMELPGFRKGHVPESVIISKIGETSLLEDAAEETLRDVLPLIFAQEKIFPIANPKIEIIVLAPGNPLKFKMTVPVMPEFEMPDYKSIAQKITSKKEDVPETSEKEISEAMEQVRRIAFGKQTGMENEEGTLPEINDETVKRIGSFKNVDELKERIKKDLNQDKKNKALEKKRLEMIEKLVETAKIETPEALVENEIGRMENQFRSDIERMGMKFDDYLTKIKKNTEELRKEWKTSAEKRVSYDIIAGRIASAEKILPTAEEVEHESAHIMEHHKDANPESVRNYVEHTLIHRKVFEFLEKQL